MQKRNDKRLERTRKLLIDTMFALLTSNTFENINVNDICAAACVSRTTFYTHFQDKYQLVISCMEEFQRGIGLLTGKGDFADIIYTTMAAIEANQAVFRNLFTGKENRELENMLLQFLAEQCTNALEEQQALGVVFSVTVNVVAQFFAYGMAGIIVQWVTKKLNITKDELAAYLLEMSRMDPYSTYR